MDAIGFLEYNSIAKGIESADSALKAANIKLISAFAGCPGKYYFLFAGDVSAVDSALQAGEEVGGANVVDKTFIPRVHPDVIQAMTKSTALRQHGAVGIMEFFSVTASIFAADAAVKAADISLIEVRTGIGVGGKSFVTLCGEVSAVNAAVMAGTQGEEVRGMLINRVVIANPDEALLENLY